MQNKRFRKLKRQSLSQNEMTGGMVQHQSWIGVDFSDVVLVESYIRTENAPLNSQNEMTRIALFTGETFIVEISFDEAFDCWKSSKEETLYFKSQCN